jgi:hypothetical protein
VPLIEEACRRAGIAADRLGRGVDRVMDDPERELVKYDLVFATARSAMEAIAAGAATIVMDGRGLAGMAARENFQHLRRHNFGLRSLVHEVTLESILQEIGKYDPAEAAALSELFKNEAGLERQLDRFEEIYAAMLQEFPSRDINDVAFLALLAPILHRWLPRFPGTDWPWQFEKTALLEQVRQLDHALAQERMARAREMSFLLDRPLYRQIGSAIKRKLFP